MGPKNIEPLILLSCKLWAEQLSRVFPRLSVLSEDAIPKKGEENIATKPKAEICSREGSASCFFSMHFHSAEERETFHFGGHHCFQILRIYSSECTCAQELLL